MDSNEEQLHRERVERVLKGIEEIKRGRFVILLDDENRENEGDLVTAAELITPDKVNFYLHKARGMICVPMSAERCEELDLPLLVDNYPRDAKHTAYCMTVDYRWGTTTGISAHDQALTIKMLADPKARPEDFTRPGHIHPLRALPGGVLKRVGHTEGAVDLCKLAGLRPVAVVCEIMNEDGSMARKPDLLAFAQREGIHLMYIADLVYYRLLHESWVERIDEAELPTRWGSFRAIAFRTKDGSEEHLAVVKGTISPDQPVLVRMHSECLTGDALGSLRCDCGLQLEFAMERIAEEGQGVLVYLRNHEGRGIGLANKLRAYHLQDRGMDTVEANLHLGFPPDKRDFGVGAQILRDLGVRKIRLITNNPKKLVGLSGYGLEIVERIPIPLEVMRTRYNQRYLETKRERLGHLIREVEEADPAQEG